MATTPYSSPYGSYGAPGGSNPYGSASASAPMQLNAASSYSHLGSGANGGFTTTDLVNMRKDPSLAMGTPLEQYLQTMPGGRQLLQLPAGPSLIPTINNRLGIAAHPQPQFGTPATAANAAAPNAAAAPMGGGPNASGTLPGGVNPYLQQQIDGLQTQFTNNLNRTTLPAIRSNAMGAGGFGGSRQGIAEGLAAGNAQTGFANAATQLLGSDYENQQNRNLQQYGMDQNFNLGQGNLALGNKNSDQSYTLGQGQLALGNLNAQNNYNLGLGQNATQAQSVANQYALGQGQNANTAAQIANQYALGNQGQQLDFYTNQRGQDLNSLQVGANLVNSGITGAWNPITNFNNVVGTYSGNGTTSGTTSSGGGAIGALGGALGGMQIANMATNPSANLGYGLPYKSPV